MDRIEVDRGDSTNSLEWLCRVIVNQYGFKTARVVPESEPADRAADRPEVLLCVSCEKQPSCAAPFASECSSYLPKTADRPEAVGDSVAVELHKELKKAETKFPTWPEDIIHAAAVVQEECGELVRAALQYVYEGGSVESVRKEAIQTGAMAMRFLKNLDKLKAIKCRQV